MNGNGQLLLQLCTEFNLFISSTQFCHKGDHITTWMHPRSRQWHLLDYVIVHQRDMQDVCNVRTLRGADCWTDHALVRAKFRMVIKTAARLRTTVKLPKRLDVSKLHSAEFQESLLEGMNAVAYTHHHGMLQRTISIRLPRRPSALLLPRVGTGLMRTIRQ